jgi:hypothetical protein
MGGRSSCAACLVNSNCLRCALDGTRGGPPTSEKDQAQDHHTKLISSHPAYRPRVSLHRR